MRPLIGITVNYCEEDLGSASKLGLAGQRWHTLADDYIWAVERAGGLPLMIPVYRDCETAFELMDRCDGILLSGGNDVAPTHYGQSFGEKVGRISPRRDAQELLMAKRLLNKMSVPVLGICRGIQILNIACGGDLYQDLLQEGYDHVAWGAPLDSFVHPVTLAEGSLLADIVGEQRMWVNSYHHQAVRQAGTGLAVSASSDDGVTEAIELPGPRFVLAVQWHPEMLFSCNINQCIFERFVAACR